MPETLEQFPNSISPRYRAMEPTNTLTTAKWHGLLAKVFLTLETSRLMFLRLVRAEGRKATNKLKYVEATSAALDACLHPSSRRMRRGNQYASWTLCGVCGNRLSYTPKGSQPKSKAKPKAKAYPAIPPVTTEVDREVDSMLEVMEPSCTTRTTLPERPSSRASSSTDLKPFTEEMKMLSTFMQNMMSGMAQQNAHLAQMMGNLGTSVESMANNQSQMLLMMSNEAPSAESKNLEQLRQQAKRSEGLMEEEDKASQWSMMSGLENLNALGPADL